jgi:hypothetical protein
MGFGEVGNQAIQVTGTCGIPSNASSVVVNLTVAAHGHGVPDRSHLAVWSGQILAVFLTPGGHGQDHVIGGRQAPPREKGLPVGLKGFRPAGQPVSHAAKGTSGGI